MQADRPPSVPILIDIASPSIHLPCMPIVVDTASPSIPYEALNEEREALRRAAIHLCAMILADASGSRGGGYLSQNGALLDLENASIRFVRRGDELLVAASLVSDRPCD